MNERRGGRRQRKFAVKHPGEIDRDAIADLLTKLALGALEERQDFALRIILHGIQQHRRDTPGAPRLAGSVQKNRRALKMYKKREAPFNSFARWRGRLFAAGPGGIYEIEDIPLGIRADPHVGLDDAIADPLRKWAMLHQHLAGFQNIDPNVPWNGGSTDHEGVPSTTADVLLDGFAHPMCQGDGLAGYVYLAITKGLAIEASMAWFDDKPKQMRKGWNYGRLLMLAADQAGVIPPTSRCGMEGWMQRGRLSAEEMLAPAITYSDGRSLSVFDMEFPEA